MIGELDKVPGTVYSSVYNGVKDGIDDKNECVTNPITGKKTCIISNSKRDSAAVLFSDGSQYDVDYNVLDWRELSEGIGDLLANYTIEQF